MPGGSEALGMGRGMGVEVELGVGVGVGVGMGIGTDRGVWEFLLPFPLGRANGDGRLWGGSGARAPVCSVGSQAARVAVERGAFDGAAVRDHDHDALLPRGVGGELSAEPEHGGNAWCGQTSRLESGC